jgi:deferrochelatase/peroxidase EfeB
LEPLRERQLSVCVGFGPGFFSRFGLTAPAGFASLPPADNTQAFDLGIYVMSRSSAMLAQFLQGLAETNAFTAVQIERGYQRTDRRELFGFRDGLRNARGEREESCGVR